MLGPENPFTLITIANLAEAFLNQRQCKEAEELLLQVIKTQEKVLVLENCSKLRTMAPACVDILASRAVGRGQGAVFGNHIERKDSAGAGSSFQIDERSQPCGNILESREVHGG